jgi:hypothetical protein
MMNFYDQNVQCVIGNKKKAGIFMQVCVMLDVMTLE